MGNEVSQADAFGTRATLQDGITYHRLGALAERGVADVDRLPVTFRLCHGKLKVLAPLK